MDQLCAGPCMPIEEERNKSGGGGGNVGRQRLEPPAMTTVSDTSSDGTIASSDGAPNDERTTTSIIVLPVGKPGEISPQSTCTQRKLSAAVVSTDACRSPSKYTEGRAQVVLPGIHKEAARALSSSSLHRSPSVPHHPRLASFTTDPPPLRLDAWAETPASNFKVRSRDYLRTQQKVPSEESVFQLLCVDLVQVDQPLLQTGLCGHPGERVQKALRLEQETGQRILPQFIFAVNLCVPGKSNYHWVAYFGIDDVSVLTDPETAFGRVAHPFFFGDSDKYRDQTFKLIPRIIEGNVLVRKAVGSKPAILGRKIRQSYIRTERYMEIIVDIASDKVAQRIVKLALGYIANLQVDMVFVLEGASEETLPERILGGCRVMNLDFKRKDGQRIVHPPPA